MLNILDESWVTWWVSCAKVRRSSNAPSPNLYLCSTPIYQTTRASKININVNI